MTEPVSFGTTLLAIVLGIFGLIFFVLIPALFKLIPVILGIMLTLVLVAIVAVLTPIVMFVRWLTGGPSHRLPSEHRERHGYSPWGR
jgi:hypothetical protein